MICAGQRGEGRAGTVALPGISPMPGLHWTDIPVRRGGILMDVARCLVV